MDAEFCARMRRAITAGEEKPPGEIAERLRRAGWWFSAVVNNAGAMYGTRQLTKDGIELTWAVNHLAPFLLSKLLLHRLKESAPARIITTASQAHQEAHIPFNDLNAE
jgi:NAD(P)-dependent dehydrogenase (short-subunit alcohol dehydrogenase family)